MTRRSQSWTRVRPGLYARGDLRIRRHPAEHDPSRPWDLYRPLDGGTWSLGRFHTLTLAKRAADQEDTP